MRNAAHIIAIVGLSIAVWAGPSAAVQGASTLASVPGQTSVPAFQGQAAEQFLQTARIIEVKPLGEGVTRPRKVTLERDGVTQNAVFKWIDERRQGVIELDDGSTVFGFRDSWETEVAAYRVDRMIGLGMVPATVERGVQGDEGSLQWWVDAEMSEADRIELGLQAPDVEAWNRQRFNVWLFDELIANADRHMDNILITEDFQVRLIDHSRSFWETESVQHPERLTRFSRALLDAIERLTFDDLKVQIGRHVSNDGIQRVLDRRDDILALARARVAEFGEAAVIFP